MSVFVQNIVGMIANYASLLSYIHTGAIIRDGDRKRAPFLILGLATWYGTMFFIFRTNCAITCGTGAYMLRGFLADVARKKWRPKFPKSFMLVAHYTCNAFITVGILLKYFRGKLLQFEWKQSVPNLGMSRFISLTKLSPAAPFTRTAHYSNLNFTYEED